MEDGMTAIVVSYHRPDSLQSLLIDLAGTHTIVVNVEDDPTVREVAAGSATIAVAGNPGFAAAVNLGVAACTTEFVAFMNDDVRCRTDQLEALAVAIRDGAHVAVPRVVDQRGEPERTVLALPGLGALLREWALLPDTPVRGLAGRLGVEKWRLPLSQEPVAAASAMCVMTTAALLRAEPLPEAYFLYWEEEEWFWRLHRRGASVRYEPTAEITHLGGRADVRPDKSRLLARNAVRCVRRTQGRAAAGIAWPIVVAWQGRLMIIALARSVVRRRRDVMLTSRVAGMGAALRAWREVVAPVVAEGGDGR